MSDKIKRMLKNEIQQMWQTDKDVYKRQGHEKRIYPRIGAIIETPGFYPNLTGTENLEIFAKLRGTPQPNDISEEDFESRHLLPGVRDTAEHFPRITLS